MGDSLVNRPVTDMHDAIHTMNATHFDQTSIRTDSRESASKEGRSSIEGRSSLIITEIKVNQQGRHTNSMQENLWSTQDDAKISSFHNTKRSSF
jgi:hypothetical protein